MGGNVRNPKAQCRVSGVLALASAFLLCGAPVRAGTGTSYTYKGGSANWTSVAAWDVGSGSPGLIPGTPYDSATVNSGSVNYDAGPIDLDSFTLSNAVASGASGS